MRQIRAPPECWRIHIQTEQSHHINSEREAHLAGCIALSMFKWYGHLSGSEQTCIRVVLVSDAWLPPLRTTRPLPCHKEVADRL